VQTTIFQSLISTITLETVAKKNHITSVLIYHIKSIEKLDHSILKMTKFTVNPLWNGMSNILGIFKSDMKLHIHCNTCIEKAITRLHEAHESQSKSVESIYHGYPHSRVALYMMIFPKSCIQFGVLVK